MPVPGHKKPIGLGHQLAGRVDHGDRPGRLATLAAEQELPQHRTARRHRHRRGYRIVERAIAKLRRLAYPICSCPDRCGAELQAQAANHPRHGHRDRDQRANAEQYT
jgi:hypothetical protein